MKFNILCASFISISLNIRADVWIQKSDFSGNARGAAVGFSINGKGFIGTGSAYSEGYSKTLWEYNPTMDAWTQKADFAGAGRAYSVSFVIGGKGYVGTGQTNTNSFTDDFWEYDPIANYWTQKATVPGGKRHGAFAIVINGKGYIGCGGLGNYYKEDFWEYDAANDVWTKKANYGGGKVLSPTGFVIGGKGYVGTGRDDLTLGFRKDFWEYDPIADSWTQKSDFGGEERDVAVGFSINNLGYLGIGFTIDTFTKDLFDFWQYDPLMDTWIQKTNFPGDGAESAAVISINDTVYVGTGSSSGKQIWQFDPDSSIATNAMEISSNEPCFLINPTVFSSSSTIKFFNEENSPITIGLFNSEGRKIKTLLDQTITTGYHQLELKRDQLSAGIYFLKINMNNESTVKKVIIQ